jgi:hypothetical protein
MMQFRREYDQSRARAPVGLPVPLREIDEVVEFPTAPQSESPPRQLDRERRSEAVKRFHRSPAIHSYTPALTTLAETPRASLA